MEITKENEIAIRKLNYLLKVYDGLNKLIVSTKNRLQCLIPEAKVEHDPYLYGTEKMTGFEKIKDKLSRNIERVLEFWPVWYLWLKNVPGIGPYIAGKLIRFWYYRFVPVCVKCGGNLEKAKGEEEKGYRCLSCKKKAKGDGNLRYRIEMRDFPKISAWWHFMGRHGDESGHMPKMQKGVQVDWNVEGRALGYAIGDQFNRQDGDHLYKMHFLGQKKKYEKKTECTDWSKGRIHNYARNNVVKFFLSHFWTVARTIDGKPLTEPYIGGAKDRVHNIIPPYYWDGVVPPLNNGNGKKRARVKF